MCVLDGYEKVPANTQGGKRSLLNLCEGVCEEKGVFIRVGKEGVLVLVIAAVCKLLQYI